MKEISIKIANSDIRKELESIDFDSAFVNSAIDKYKGKLYKIFNLKTPGANILKQTCLSLGFDCAVSRNTVTCKDEYTDCILFITPDKISKLSEKLKHQPFGLSKIGALLNDLSTNELSPLTLSGAFFDWKRPYIMGILNVTPDSFSDGGKYTVIDNAIKHCEEMIQSGADIIDIGGESTRPGADAVSVEEEINRIIPVIKKIRENTKIPISVDTRNYLTAKAATENGADIINDVSGLDYDEKLRDYVCLNNLPVVIMHSDKVPASSADFTSGDIIENIYFKFEKKIRMLEERGLESSKIIIDPGVGFGKSQAGNFEILKRLNEFTSLKKPILLGISRKSFMRNEFNIGIEEADAPTALYGALCPDANIHRVHNVNLAAKFLKFSQKIK